MLTGRVDDHVPALGAGKLFEPGFDPALVMRWAAINDRPIDFSTPSANSAPKRRSALGWRPSTRQPASVAIEPVGEGRGVRQPKPQRTKTTLKIGTAPGACMHGDARGLVDDRDQPVAIEDAILE